MSTTAEAQKEILGVGWDVGGWLGKKQGVAVLRARKDKRTWCGTPRAFRIRDLTELGGDPLSLIRLAWKDAPKDALEQFRVVIAIDAPLGFPAAFRDLVNGGKGPATCPTTEIESLLAYRETDRAVFREFSKKPLSVSFDKLGNNATVALAHVRRWRHQNGVSVLPLDAAPVHGTVAIEVYPALAKSQNSGPGKRPASPIVRLLPPGLVADSDEQDAAICALMATAFGLRGASVELPPLVGPPATLDAACLREEGWIYYPGPSWLTGAAA